MKAIAPVIYFWAGLVGLYLFMKGCMAAAFLLSLSVTQIWRIASEFLRADYRADGKTFAYQIMGGLGVLYGIGAAFYYAGTAPVLLELGVGNSRLWHPGVLLGLQGLSILSFLYTGRSKVTGRSCRFM